MTPKQAQQDVVVHAFIETFAATRLGARLAWKCAVGQLDDWGVPPGAPLSDTVALLVAELAANAARHGHVPGRNFELRLLYERESAVVRVEVSDTHSRRPDSSAVTMAGPDAEGGRGLPLVAALAHCWGVDERTGPGKTVWAQTGPVGPPESP